MNETVRCICGWESDPESFLIPTHCPDCGAKLEISDSDPSSDEPFESIVVESPPAPFLSDDEAFEKLMEDAPEETLDDIDEFGNRIIKKQESKPKPKRKTKKDKRREVELELLAEEVRYIRDSAIDRYVENVGERRDAIAAAKETKAAQRRVNRTRMQGVMSAFGFLLWFPQAPVVALYAVSQAARNSQGGRGAQEAAELKAAKNRMRETKKLAAKGRRAVGDLLRRQWSLETIADEKSKLRNWVNHVGAGLTVLVILFVSSLAAFLLSLGDIFTATIVAVSGIFAARFVWWKWLGPIKKAMRDYPSIRRPAEDSFPHRHCRGYMWLCIGLGLLSFGLMAGMVLLQVERYG